MKSFLWRIRSNVGWFVAAMALFTALYFVLYASNYRAYDSDVFTYINGLAVNPLGPAGGCTLGFFLLCTKRFTNKESYLYGVSRRAEYLSGLGSATCWSVLSALYALSVSLLTRYCFLSASDMAVPDTVYTLGAGECFAGFALLFVVNMDAYATADILRDFRTRPVLDHVSRLSRGRRVSAVGVLAVGQHRGILGPALCVVRHVFTDNLCG